MEVKLNLEIFIVALQLQLVIHISYFTYSTADVNSTDECAQQTEKQPPMPNKALIRNSFKCYNQFDLEAVVRKPVIKDESCGLSGQIIQSETLTEQLKDLLDKNWTKDCTRKCNVKAEGQTALETEVEAHIKSRGVCSSLCDIVQRLLDIKYPQPPLAQGQDLPQPKVNFLNKLIFTEIKMSNYKL